MNFILLFFSIPCHAGFWGDLGNELASPVTTNAKYYFLGGAALTGITVIDSVEDGLGHDLQDETVEDKPLGSFSQVGDIAGQMVPNAIYAVSMYGIYYYSDNLSYRSKSLHMLKSTVYAGFTTTVLKMAIREPRPDSDNRDSFPSGHTTSAFAFAAVVGTEHEWYWGVAAYSLAGLVAWSRINDNAHRLHDVLGGATIGLSYGLSLHYLYKDKDSEVAKIFLAPQRDGWIVGYRTDF